MKKSLTTTNLLIIKKIETKEEQVTGCFFVISFNFFLVYFKNHGFKIQVLFFEINKFVLS